ncbi:MAG TPA: polysaccharide biosynthesis tyrosine autokinase [Rhodanobacteraceae bacterium]|nr:polysaccharide biosynthesis tyrosine autokinase [Rhodanobacteraceae bacterium]
MATHPDHLPAAPRGEGGQLPTVHPQGPDGRQLRPLPTSRALVTDLERRDDDDEIDLLAYWRLLVKRRWLVLGVLLAVVAAALIWTLLTPSVYRATATLQIDPYGMQVVQVQGISPIQGRYDPDFNQTQYELLKSRSLAERVAEDLHLAGSDIFQRIQPPGWFDRLRGLLDPADAKQGKQATRPTLAPGEKAPTPAQQLARATGLVQGGLNITPVRNSHLVQVQYDSTLPDFAAKVANAVADGFIAASMDRQYGASSYAKKYLEDQLALLKSRLEDSERKLVEYAKAKDIVPGSDGKSLVEQNLTDLNRSLATAQDQRIRAQARWEQAKIADGAALPADMLGNSILRSLQQQRAQLQGKYQDQLHTFKPEYPSMLALKSQIDEVQKQINKELGNIRSSVKAEYDAALAQETMLKSQLDHLREESLQVETRSIQYNILKRDVDTNRELYNGLLQRYKQVGLAGGAKTSNISVVDRAMVPAGRYSPSLKRNLGLGILLGLMLGVGLALLLEYLDNTIKTPQDVEHLLKLGVLGIIPKLGKQRPDEALEDPRSAFSESYRSVRTALQFSTERGVPKILLLTSTKSGEGKSTSALTLARSFAQLGKRVLLVEADLRNPGLGRAMGLSTATGLSSLLAGAAPLSQALTHTDDPCLDVLLSGPLPPSPTELLAGVKFVSLMTVAANKYDQIIIDGPPVLGIADAPILANVATGTLLVVQAGVTQIQPAQTAIKRLRMTRARLVGCLLTQYDARQSGFGYSYEGYYAYGAAPQLGHQ